jgi:hypothetical protein
MRLARPPATYIRLTTSERVLGHERLPLRHAGRMPFNGRFMIRLPRQLEKMQAMGFELLLFRV